MSSSFLIRSARLRSAALVLPLVLAPAAPAFSQALTAAELWAAWQAGVAEAGGTLSAGAESREGNRLVLRDVRLQGDPTAVRSTSLHLETMSLVNRADGSVGISLPDSFPLSLTMQRPVERDTPALPGEGQIIETEEVRLLVAAPGLDLAIQGIGARSGFTAKAPSVSVTLDAIVPPPEPGQPTLDLVLALADLNLRYAHDVSAPLRSFNGELSLGTLHAEIGAHDSGGDPMTAIFDLAGARMHLGAALPQEAIPLLEAPEPPPPAALLALLDAGGFFDLAIVLDRIEQTTTVVQAEDTPTISLTALGAEAKARLDRKALAQEVSLKGLDLRAPLPGPMGELPLHIGLNEYRIGYMVGLNGLQGVQNWGYRLLLDQLSISDEVWRQADPKALLPHDPLSLDIDLEGTYAIQPEALQPDWQPRPDTTDPLTDFSFRFRTLNFSGVGLGLLGTGGLVFDTSDLLSYDGMPAPTGELNFVTHGVNALLDSAIEAGLLEQEAILGVRSALMMMAKPGKEPGSLTTDLRFEGPSFFLNGIKIR